MTKWEYLIETVELHHWQAYMPSRIGKEDPEAERWNEFARKANAERNRDPISASAHLNRRGAEGWEVVRADEEQGGNFIALKCLFKRPCGEIPEKAL